MRSLLNLFLLILITLAIVTCGKNDTTGDKTDSENKPNGFVLKPGVVYFSESQTNHVIVKDEDSIVIKPETPKNLEATVGDIILVAQGETTPSGFLGRVKSRTESSAGIVLTTEVVSLEDVFEEFHWEETIDYAGCLDQLIDENGDNLAVGDLENSVWSELESETNGSNDDDVETKASFIKETSKTKTISLGAPFFTGALILNSELYVKINITKGIIDDFTVKLGTNSSLKGTIHVEGSHHVADLKEARTIRLPGAIMVGPIALRPAIVYGIALSAEGKIKMDGPLTIGLSSIETTWEKNKEPQTFIDKSHPAKCSATYLDCDGAIKIEGRIGFQFGVFRQDVLAFGVDWQPEVSLGLSGKMSMDKKDVMAEDIHARLSGSFGSLGAYMYSRFFSAGALDKLRVSFQTPEFSYVIPLFSQGQKHNCVKRTGNWALSGEYGKVQLLMDVDKTGYALFKAGQDEPVQLIAVPVSHAGVKAGDVSFTFTIQGNPADYCVKTLNIVGDYSFYGPVVGNFVSKLHHHDAQNKRYSYTYTFSYDNYGRISGMTLPGDGKYDTVSYSYTDDQISLNWGWKTETVTIDSHGRLVSYAGDGHNRVFTYSPNSIVINETHLRGDDTYVNAVTTLSYYNGDMTARTHRVIKNDYFESSYTENHYSYTTLPDNYSVDFIHSLVDGLGIETTPLFLCFPELHNVHLLSSGSNEEASTRLTYSFDEKERVTTVSWGDDGMQNVIDVTYVNL